MILCLSDDGLYVVRGMKIDGVNSDAASQMTGR